MSSHPEGSSQQRFWQRLLIKGSATVLPHCEPWAVVTICATSQPFPPAISAIYTPFLMRPFLHQLERYPPHKKSTARQQQLRITARESQTRANAKEPSPQLRHEQHHSAGDSGVTQGTGNTFTGLPCLLLTMPPLF